MSRAILHASLLAAAVLGAATGACAQGETDNAHLFAVVRRAAADAAPPARALPLADRDVPAPRPAGVAQTAIDHPFADRRLTGSVGFLCGLQPTPEIKGAASAYGADDQGRFLGAKLRFAFR